MKFPKWNHPWLCQQLLYLPAYLLFLLPPIGAILLEAFGIDVPGIAFLIVFFICGGCAVWYLLRGQNTRPGRMRHRLSTA